MTFEDFNAKYRRIYSDDEHLMREFENYDKLRNPDERETYLYCLDRWLVRYDELFPVKEKTRLKDGELC